MSNIKFEKGRFLFEFHRLIIEGTILDISEKAVKIKWAKRGVTLEQVRKIRELIQKP